MSWYVTKQRRVEAERFFHDQPLPFARRGDACCLDEQGWYVVTAHGQRTAIVDGDMIIPEPDGRGFYPCKPDIFASRHNPASRVVATTRKWTEEPWLTGLPGFGYSHEITDEVDHHEERALLPYVDYDRAIACVNACAGMADPAAEITALKGKQS